MNSLTRMMSYDKAKSKNQEQCNCVECVSVENAELKNQTIEYPTLSEEEIEQIINEIYSYKDEKTKTFIRKALRIHGNRYDYSNAVYVNTKIKIEIICKINNHKNFLQRPNDHLKGCGCKECAKKYFGASKRLTLEEFIKKSNEIQGEGRYDYSKVEYKNTNTKVCIICNNHDEPYEFWQTPSNHLNGHGCPKCARIEKLTLKEFIEKANRVHGVGTYDYSESKYINTITPIKIICLIHGGFWQTPNVHLGGSGCPKCANELVHERQKLTLKEFIEKANEVQGIGRYDYSKVKYINAHTKVIIICPKHGEFSQLPYAHLKGRGCMLCCEKSKGETKIRIFLINNNISFEQEKRFKECRDKNPLPFDFYLPQYNLCIEFDGEQHFKPFAFNSRKVSDDIKLENLKKVQKHDQMKNDYCKKNGITLLRINDIRKINKILNDYFKIKN